MHLDALIAKQNIDGGWPYVRGGSSTEPTTYAILALLAVGETGPARKGIRWLLNQQKPDGGWAPQPCVAESSWVTALVALLPPELLGETAHTRAIEWLLDVTGTESTRTYRLISWLFGNRIPPQQARAGWPWVPGTAAWVTPTAFAILALEKACRRRESLKAKERMMEGRDFLLLRTCEEGGWNHGSVADLRSPAHAYPETTGLALCAMRGVKGPKIERALVLARSLLDDCRSADGIHWLLLGLLAQGESLRGYQPPAEIPCRTFSDVSLRALVTAAEAGRSPLWE